MRQTTFKGVMNACRTALFLACGLRATSAWAGPKVDAVQLKNGDHLTCEIKKLEQGELTISTDPLDTVTVHWAEVAGLTSPREFEVTVESGARYYGSLSVSTPGQLNVSDATGVTLTFTLAEVTALVPIGGSVWSRMDGNIDLGFSFAQANLETHWTLNSAATYRSSKYLLSASLASQITARSDVTTNTSRNSFTSTNNRLFTDLWFATAIAQLQQNEELSLDLRTVAGGGGGKILSQTNSRNINVFLGLVYTREQFTDQPISNSAEMALGAQVNFFTSGTREFVLDNSIVSFFDVTGRGRVRVEAQSAWKHKFWKDLYYAMNGYESFDSDPPDNEKKNDASISLSLGWTF